MHTKDEMFQGIGRQSSREIRYENLLTKTAGCSFWTRFFRLFLTLSGNGADMCVVDPDLPTG